VWASASISRFLIITSVRNLCGPSGAKPKVVVESVSDRPTRWALALRHPRNLEIILANQGTTHASMGDMTLVQPVGPTGAPLKNNAPSLSPPGISGHEQHLLAGEQRRFAHPAPVRSAGLDPSASS